MKIEFLHKSIESYDWAIGLFIFCLLIISYNKYYFSSVFSDFTSLFLNDRYLISNQIKKETKNWFHYSLILVQWITFSFLLYLLANRYQIKHQENWVFFVQIMIASLFFIVTKHLIEKIIVIILNLENISNDINTVKSSYKNFIGIIHLPLIMLFFYFKHLPNLIFDIYLICFVLTHIWIYIKVAKIHVKMIKTYFIYFILYIYVFEFLPYLFMYNSISIFQD